MNVYTLRILVHFTQRYRPDLRMQTYEELMQHALGDTAFRIAAFCVIVGIIGALTGTSSCGRGRGGVAMMLRLMDP